MIDGRHEENGRLSGRCFLGVLVGHVVGLVKADDEVSLCHIMKTMVDRVGILEVVVWPSQITFQPSIIHQFVPSY